MVRSSDCLILFDLSVFKVNSGHPFLTLRIGIMSLYQILSSLRAVCGLQSTGLGYPENTQGFEYVCIIIDEGVLWRAPRILVLWKWLLHVKCVIEVEIIR